MALDIEDKVVREMVQAKLLARIFAACAPGDLALKGGMAMRVSTGSTGLTKDIDLMSPPGLDRVEGRIKTAMAEMKATGLISSLVCTQPKRTDTTWRWKIGGKVGSTVSKLSCLIDPQREAPRDVFDLHMLVTSHVRPPVEALRLLGRERLEQGMKTIWDKLEKMDYAAAATELLPHLQGESRLSFTPELWDEMRMVAGTSLEAWFREALDPDEEAMATAGAPGR